MKTYGGLKVSLHAFLNSALNGSGQLYAPTALSPTKKLPIRIAQKAGWAPEPV
jgi:hypothetical protein